MMIRKKKSSTPKMVEKLKRSENDMKKIMITARPPAFICYVFFGTIKGTFFIYRIRDNSPRWNTIFI